MSHSVLACQIFWEETGEIDECGAQTGRSLGLVFVPMEVLLLINLTSSVKFIEKSFE